MSNGQTDTDTTAAEGLEPLSEAELADIESECAAARTERQIEINDHITADTGERVEDWPLELETPVYRLEALLAEVRASRRAPTPPGGRETQRSIYAHHVAQAGLPAAPSPGAVTQVGNKFKQFFARSREGDEVPFSEEALDALVDQLPLGDARSAIRDLRQRLSRLQSACEGEAGANIRRVHDEVTRQELAKDICRHRHVMQFGSEPWRPNELEEKVNAHFMFDLPLVDNILSRLWNEEPTPEQQAEMANNDGPLSRGQLEPWEFYKLIRAAGPSPRPGEEERLRTFERLETAVRAFVADEDRLFEELKAEGKKLEDYGFPFPLMVQIRESLAALRPTAQDGEELSLKAGAA